MGNGNRESPARRRGLVFEQLQKPSISTQRLDISINAWSNASTDKGTIAGVSCLTSTAGGEKKPRK